MERIGVLLMPLEPGVEKGMDCVAGGDFFWPVSLERISDIEKGEEWVRVGLMLVIVQHTLEMAAQP